MIKEINPQKYDREYDISLCLLKDEKLYFDEENNEYFREIPSIHREYINLKGEWHRENKPACYYYLNNKIYVTFWILNNDLHRIDGPAKDYLDFYSSNFYINGKYYCHFEFAEKTNHLLCKICYKFCKQECFI